MEKYADQQTYDEIREMLFTALERRHPFSNFRYAVDDAGLLKDWYKFREDWYRQKAEEWMKDHGVDFKDGRITAEKTEHFYHENYDYYDGDDEEEELDS